MTTTAPEAPLVSPVNGQALRHPLLGGADPAAFPPVAGAEAPEEEQAEAQPAKKLRPITRAVKAQIAVITAAVVALFADGMIASFRAVSTEMAPWFGTLSWTVPVGVDVGIFGFSGLDLLLAYLDLGVWWLKWVPRLLTAGTIALNEAAGGSAPARLAHVLLPSLAIVAVEVGVRVVRKRTGLEHGTRRETIPFARWIFSPWPTFKLCRRMVLWKIYSYDEALELELRRLSGETRARTLYGDDWKTQVPGEVRLLLEMGRIGSRDIPRPGEEPWWCRTEDGPDGPGEADQRTGGPHKEPDRSAFQDGPDGPRKRTSGRALRGRGRTDADQDAPNEPDHVLATVAEIARELTKAGEPINRKTLRAALGARGMTADNRRIGPLIKYAQVQARS